MSFQRLLANRWSNEVPGARWYKADLHIHTIDDHPGGRARIPVGLTGELDDPETLSRYARSFLRSLVEKDVQIAGITPHSPRVGENTARSAAWTIVEAWNCDQDDDGVPFREKIYGVFPGFEPSFNNGKEGLHILFLFDPEIGRERYFRAFDLVMGGISPWADGALQISSKQAGEAFEELRGLWEREACSNGQVQSSWNYIVLAPHIDSSKGLLGAQKAQVLRLFDHREIAGLELGDEKLPDDELRNRNWLGEGMARHRQAFFHGSDAYALRDIGRRNTWFKLASPRIESLRQALVASDSRLRIGFERASSGKLVEIGSPPDVLLNERPWLREVAVRGGASFFGRKEKDKPPETRFRLSPDLTCVIGGSMTGKSTLLDGLRIHTNAPLPGNRSIREQVERRGRDIFGAGAPEIETQFPNADPLAPLRDRWPAQFFGQGELQRLALEPAAVQSILAGLVPAETEGIRSREEELCVLDERLSRSASLLNGLDEKLADAEQAYELAKRAKSELAAVSKVGAGELHRVGREHQAWMEARQTVGSIRDSVRDTLETASALEILEVDSDLTVSFQCKGIGRKDSDLRDRWREIVNLLQHVEREISTWTESSDEVVNGLRRRESDLRSEVERALAERGLDAVKLKQVQQLNRRASLIASHKANYEQIHKRLGREEAQFSELLSKRNTIVDQQRDAFERVIGQIERGFATRIRVCRIDHGISEPLQSWLEGLRQRGVTRWWKELEPEKRPSPEELIAKLRSNSLLCIGMSRAVQKTFRECITQSRVRELAALRCSDQYLLEFRVDENEYRRLDELSGGQRVSVLLALLLEATDQGPLVIDQPEDELDNRFLFDTVLPALKKLRGRRQVIVATHNANIVVNGDADLVVQLDATARRGWVACEGAIEEPAVRDAIVQTVDGGKEAFRLRRRKYGF